MNSFKTEEWVTVKIIKIGVAIFATLTFYYCFTIGYSWTSNWEWKIQSYIGNK